jgi:hypothetical protein
MQALHDYILLHLHRNLKEVTMCMGLLADATGSEEKQGKGRKKYTTLTLSQRWQACALKQKVSVDCTR